jgi:hypothetical protein
MGSNCAACGETIIYSGRGRPRKYCEACVPAGSGGGAWEAAWLREHRDEIEAERRRKHAEWMAEWRANIRRRREQIARNRRQIDRKRKQKAA